MTNSSSRRPAAAAALVAGPLLFTLGDLLRRHATPSGTPSTAALTAAVGQHGGEWLLAGLLSLAAAFCLVPAMAALTASAQGRGGRTTRIGSLLLGAGSLAGVGHAAAFYAPYALYAKAGTPAADADALDTASNSYPLLVVLIALFMLGMIVGPLVLFAGLRRARRVPVWSVVAAVVFVVSGSTGSVAAGLVGIVAALAGFVPAARSLTAAEVGAAPAAPGSRVSVEV